MPPKNAGAQAGVVTPKTDVFFHPKNRSLLPKGGLKHDFSNLWASASGIFCVWLVASGQCFPEAKWPVEMGRNGRAGWRG